MSERSYFGKYRGKVELNLDPELRGRIQVSCAEVLGDGKLAWAMPCVPYADTGAGWFAIPPIGADVWVEFEGGRKESPIWSGCFWGLPATAPTPLGEPVKMFKTAGFTVTVMDLPPAFATMDIEMNPGPFPFKLSVGPAGVSIEYGASKIALDGISVSINNGALEVT